MIRETPLQKRRSNTRIAGLTICFASALGIVVLISQAACRNNDKTMITGSSDVSERDGLDDDFEQDIRNLGDEALYDLGVKLYDAKENGRSVTVFKECVRRGVKPDESSFKLGVALVGLGHTIEGIEALKQAVKSNPNHLKAHFNLGAVYYDVRDFRRSIESYEKSNLLTPDDDQTIYGIAASQYALGLYDAARVNARKALKINPDNQNASILLAMLDSRN